MVCDYANPDRLIWPSPPWRFVILDAVRISQFRSSQTHSILSGYHNGSSLCLFFILQKDVPSRSLGTRHRWRNSNLIGGYLLDPVLFHASFFLLFFLFPSHTLSFTSNHSAIPSFYSLTRPCPCVLLLPTIYITLPRILVHGLFGFFLLAFLACPKAIGPRHASILDGSKVEEANSQVVLYTVLT